LALGRAFLPYARIEGGKVHLNGTRAKRGKPVNPGDRLRLRKGPYEFRITVLELSDRRLGPKEAARLYGEEPESVEARKELADKHRDLTTAMGSMNPPAGRPSKQDRRRISRLKGRD
jgi:ribosome-associated heat shock protein Hsp15